MSKQQARINQLSLVLDDLQLARDDLITLGLRELADDVCRVEAEVAEQIAILRESP